MSLAPPEEAQDTPPMVTVASAQQPQVPIRSRRRLHRISFLGTQANDHAVARRPGTASRSHRDYYGREQSTQPIYASRAPVDPRLEQQAADYQLDPRFQRQEVAYSGTEKPGTIVIDTPNHFLYLVEGDGRAMRYGIGVGRPGFTWSGVHAVSAKKEWPDWVPPDEMLKRQPYLPHFVAGGPGNPLGARALYLGSTIYRIHGSNEPWTIGKNVSSGCIRMRNADVEDLYERVKVGTKVIVSVGPLRRCRRRQSHRQNHHLRHRRHRRRNSTSRCRRYRAGLPAARRHADRCQCR